LEDEIAFRQMKTLAKTRSLPLLLRIVMTLLLSAAWIFVASKLNIDLQVNWLLSTAIIAAILSIFFPFGRS
jgi:uncharacterized oligopeptide transporter (OPT) family protein